MIEKSALELTDARIVGPARFATYWNCVLKNGARAIAGNFGIDAGLVQVGSHAWPLTVSAAASGNAYPCSLHTQYVAYPRDEADSLDSPLERLVARSALSLLDLALRLAGIDRHVQWSSWLLSTHLHPRCIPDAIAPVTSVLTNAFPRHAVAVRCIDPRGSPGLIEAFRDHGYQTVASRQVWYFDGSRPAFRRRSEYKRDAKLLAQVQDYSCCELDSLTDADVPRLTALYRKLYLERHSSFNPHYSEQFLRRGMRDGWLRVQALRHVSGRLDGVLGRFDGESAASVPFIGYDTSLSPDLGLYRLLFAKLLRDIEVEGVLLNYSSGAGEFKKRRGGEQVVEYNAIYARHLPAPRRTALVASCRAINNRATALFRSRVL